MDKTSDDYYIYLETLIKQLRKCYSHPERYPTPEQNREHRDFLEEQFSVISLSSIISNKNLSFKYKIIALRMKVGLYQLEKIINNHIRKIFSGNYREKAKGKLYSTGEFPELFHQKLLKFYAANPAEVLDDAKRQAIEYLRELKYPIILTDIIFPYNFANKYKTLKPPVFYDKKNGLSYVEHYGKKLFFPTKMNTNEIAEYYKGLCLEQDIESPHCYTDATFSVSEGDICLDIGCAEGNFALTNIEKVKKVYLFETDPKWNSALSATFEPWKSKVEIINKFVSDKDDAQNITLDTFVKNNNIDVTFIKIDAEGAEESILKGSRKLLEKNNLKVVACTYHRNGDDKLLHGILSDNGFECSFTNGYMIFIFDKELVPPYLRRGLVRAIKTGR